MHQWKRNVVALGAAALVAACGGGGSDTTTKVNITSVKVMGDSLADSGTFGFKATVQTTVASDALVYPERVALSYGITSMCNYYTATGATTFTPNTTKTGCTNYAIAGSRINNPTAPTSQLSVIQQMTDATATANIGASELALIDGGGNDAADLVGAYLRTSTDGGATFKGLLKTVLVNDTAAIDAAAPTAFPVLGGQYMAALATKFSTAIDTSILGKGANYVAILNMPGVTNTPRFQAVLDRIALGNGGGTAGAAARAASEGMFKQWIEAFNGALATHYAGNGKVVVVDFYTSFNEEVAIPAQYSLSNVKTPVCPADATPGADGLPTYTFPACTEAYLQAHPPTGVTDTNWWKSYAFADGFHPTPFAHQLLGQLIARSLATKGWL
ncbi:SGNH/GDSL hydrolase family protein [Rhizobacter sp. P5_C2]